MNVENLYNKSLLNIQKDYLQLIKNYYHFIYNSYISSNLNKNDFTKLFLENDVNFKTSLNIYYDILEKIHSFWISNQKMALEEIKNTKKEKIILNGELFISSGHPLKKYVFITDMIILFDPFIKSEELFQHQKNNYLTAYKSIIFSLNIIDILASNEKLNDVLICIVPYDNNIIQNKGFVSEVNNLTLKYINNIYSIKFNDFNEMRSILYNTKNSDIIKNINKPLKIISDIDNRNHNPNELSLFFTEDIEYMFTDYYPSHGEILIQKINNRAAQALDGLIQSINLNSTNFMESKTSLYYYKSMLSLLNQNNIICENNSSINKIKSIKSLEIDFNWFCDIPIWKIEDMIRDGTLYEIKKEFSNIYDMLSYKDNINSEKFRSLVQKKVNILTQKISKTDKIYTLKICFGILSCLFPLSIPSFIYNLLDVFERNEFKKQNFNSDLPLNKFLNIPNNYIKGDK